VVYTWQYYDLVLLGVFLSVTTGAAVGVSTPVPVTATVLGFGLVAIATMAHAPFVDGAVDERRDLTEEVETLN
jgi:hypothetical protein